MPHPAEPRAAKLAGTDAANLQRSDPPAEEPRPAVQAMLEAVVAHVPAAICLIRGHDLRLLMVNPAYQAIAPGKPMVGRTLDELWPETGQDFAAICRRVLETGEPHVVADEPNLVRRRPDGTIEQACFSWSLHRLRLPGEPGWVLLNAAWETTGRRESEERLLLAKEAAELGIHDFDPVTGQIRWDERVRELWGIGPEETVTFATFMAGVHPDDQAAVQAAVAAALDPEGDGVYRAEYRVRSRADGRERRVAATGRVAFAEGRAVRLVGTVQDVTARAENEQALRRLAQFPEENPNPVLRVSGSGDLLYANRHARDWLAAFGWREGPLPEALDCSVAAARARGEAEDEVAAPDGTTIWLSAIRPAGEEYVNLYGRDVTGRRRAEQALARARAMLEQGQRIAHLGSWEYLVDTGTTVWSDEEFRIYGLDPGPESPSYELLLSRHIHPEDAGALNEAFGRALRDGSVFELEHRIVRPDGSVRVLYNRALPHRDDEGRLVKFMGATLDVTERKEAEEGLRRALAKAEEGDRLLTAIMEHVPEGITIAEGPRALIRLVSRHGQELLGAGHDGLTAAEVAAQWRVYRADGVTPMPRQELPLVRALERGETVTDVELVQADARGRHLPLLCNAAPLRDGRGEVVGAIVAWRDITPLKQAEERLRRANERLEEQVQERTAELSRRAAQLRALAGELTLSEQRERRRMAKMLHDHLQQILVGAKFRAVLLGRGGDEVTRQAVAEIEKLIDEGIAASRSLTAELSPPILHEGGLVPGLEWLVRWMASKHGLLVELSRDEDLPPLPEEVRVFLFESVRELLFNAVKHARVGAAAVNLRQVEGRELRITVSDEGQGFAPAELRPGGEPGGGFGLFSIRERLDLMGGRLEIDSAPGQGSRFILMVPLAAAAAVPAPAPPPPERSRDLAPRGVPRKGAPIRVLLADDHVVMRQGLANLLGDEPDIVVVGEAADGRAAVYLAAQLRPDVILMDLSMPEMNGIEATRQIHRQHPEIKMIGLSMFDAADTAQAMREAGAVFYLTKSGPADALVAAIRACMDGERGEG